MVGVTRRIRLTVLDTAGGSKKFWGEPLPQGRISREILKIVCSRRAVAPKFPAAHSPLSPRASSSRSCSCLRLLNEKEDHGSPGGAGSAFLTKQRIMAPQEAPAPLSSQSRRSSRYLRRSREKTPPAKFSVSTDTRRMPSLFAPFAPKLWSAVYQ